MHQWTVVGVHGKVSLVQVGEVIILHTLPEHVTVFTDELFSLSTQGRPVELNKDMAAQLALLLLRAAAVDHQPEPAPLELGEELTGQIEANMADPTQRRQPRRASPNE